MRSFLVGVLLIFTISLRVQAQVKVDTLDPGNADTIALRFGSVTSGGGQSASLCAELSYWADSGIIAGLSIGLKWNAEDGIRLDSAIATETAKKNFDFGTWLYRNNKIDSSNFYGQAQFFGARKFGSLLASGQSVTLARYYFTATKWSNLSVMKLDTTIFSAGSILAVSCLTLVPQSVYHRYSPVWPGPLVIYDPNRPCCVNIMGNIDGNDGVDIGDQTTLIDYLFGSGVTLTCLDAANVDGSANGAVDMADLVTLTDYLFRGGTLAECQ